MSDKYCEADPETPLLEPRPPLQDECAVGEDEEDIRARRDFINCLIGFAVLFVAVSVLCICLLFIFDPRGAVFVSSLNASSNGDTSLSIDYPVHYYKDLNVTYDARASLQSMGNASVSAAATMYYSSGKLFLHALFEIEEEEDAVVDLDLTVEANVTLVYAREMGSYMTIRCSNLSIEFERGAGRLYDSSGELCGVRTHRNGEWSEGVESQLLIEYLRSLYSYLHPTWKSMWQDPFYVWRDRLDREAGLLLDSAVTKTQLATKIPKPNARYS